MRLLESRRPLTAPEAAEGVLRESEAGTELVVIVPPSTSAGEGTCAFLLQPAEAATTALTPSVVKAVEGVVEGVGPSPPQPTAAVEEVLVPSQPAAAPQERDAPEGATGVASPQERDAPEGTTRAASPEIQEAEENFGVALSQGVGSGEAQVLELACALWATAFEASDDTEDDEVAAACNTLERGLAWVRHAFDELILTATSVSSLV
jgi:hypothetical protein